MGEGKPITQRWLAHNHVMANTLYRPDTSCKVHHQPSWSQRFITPLSSASNHGPETPRARKFLGRLLRRLAWLFWPGFLLCLLKLRIIWIVLLLRTLRLLLLLSSTSLRRRLILLAHPWQRRQSLQVRRCIRNTLILPIRSHHKRARDGRVGICVVVDKRDACARPRLGYSSRDPRLDRHVMVPPNGVARVVSVGDDHERVAVDDLRDPRVVPFLDETVGGVVQRDASREPVVCRDDARLHQSLRERALPAAYIFVSSPGDFYTSYAIDGDGVVCSSVVGAHGLGHDLDAVMQINQRLTILSENNRRKKTMVNLLWFRRMLLNLKKSTSKRQ
ncbi:hypothetical protein B0H63DRAFT_140700 [Podospora didyma]|uniref:Uncharacterized protein n=1 Tax=Podospora didyma TaxID=330526 RepID=A0AAE0NSB9_9PEZI|nr:hypothetical protein B0H63DRAFT_140700 [Podospora didyma]